MMTATSTEHNTDNSCAFLKRPPFRLRKVLQWSTRVKGKRFCHTYTDRFLSSLIALISIFLRPMLAFGAHVTFELVDGTDFKGVMDSRPALGLRVAEVGNREQRARN